MPKRQTTVALTLVSNRDGTVVLGVNAVAGPGATISEWSIDWNDGEVEDRTESLPATGTHAYVSGGAQLIVATVKDSKNKLVSEGMNLLVQPVPIPVPPEPGTLDAAIPPSDSGLPFEAKSWQYQSMAAPLLVVKK